MHVPLYGGGYGVALLQVTSFYYLVGAVLHWVVPSISKVQNFQVQARKPGDVARDSLYSLGPLAVKAGVWWLCELAHSHGISLLYDNVQIFSPWHIAYMLITILLLDYAHDTWFYWTHRLLHWKPLYVHIHYIHHQCDPTRPLCSAGSAVWPACLSLFVNIHNLLTCPRSTKAPWRSTAPSAFTGYSFHVLEAAIVFCNELIVPFLFPIHIGLHRIYHLLTTAIHLGGHAGYEISPFLPHLANLIMILKAGVHHKCSGFNTVLYHDFHHRYPMKHFSLYFTHWDRICGTLHSSFQAAK